MILSCCIIDIHQGINLTLVSPVNFEKEQYWLTELVVWSSSLIKIENCCCTISPVSHTAYNCVIGICLDHWLVNIRHNRSVWVTEDVWKLSLITACAECKCKHLLHLCDLFCVYTDLKAKGLIVYKLWFNVKYNSLKHMQKQYLK